MAKTGTCSGTGYVFALAGLSVVVTVRKRRRPTKAPQAAGPGTTALASASAPTPLATQAATADQSDPLATIAKLAQLRDAGALSEHEFEFQKAKLLADL